MSLIRYITKLRLLDDLIRRKSTGNQAEFCKKVCMSRSLLNNYINEMKRLGFPINYDRKRGTYYYSEDGRLVNSLFQRRLSEKETKQINGGCSIVLNMTTSLADVV